MLEMKSTVAIRADVAAPRETIAFLFPAFPVLHQTFVLWEVLALRRCGVPLALYSLKRPGTPSQQPEGRELTAEVHYLPPPWSRATVAANLRVLAQSPLRYLAVFPALVRHWWADRWLTRDRRSTSEAEDSAFKLLTGKERLRAFYNTSPLIYLLKSLLLVLPAAYLGSDLKRRGIERLHVHWSSYPTTVALIVHWLFDIPFSFTAHAYDIYVVPRLLSVKINEAAFAVTCAKVNAEYLRRAAGAGSRARVIVNYHGVDLDRFPPRAAEPSGDVPYIVSCGSLQVYKGHHLLIQACSQLKRPFHLVIIGDGPQRANLEALAHELGIADRVTLTGPLPQAEVAQWYAKAHIFAIASVAFDSTGKRDVIPNVLAEAMAMKVPVVASRISGIHELVEDGTSGRLVTSGDPDALATVLEELLSNPNERRRLGDGGYRRVCKIFDRKINIQELSALFVPDTSKS